MKRSELYAFLTYVCYSLGHLALDGRRLRVLGLADLVHELLVKAEMSEAGAGLGRSGAGYLSVRTKSKHGRISNAIGRRSDERYVVKR